MHAEAYAAILPAGVVRLLCDYTEEVGAAALSASFTLSDDVQHDLVAGFAPAPSCLPALFAFGVDDSHSLYAFWMLRSRDLARSPIVRLDGEGEGNRVVAENIATFASRLAAGQIGDISEGGEASPERSQFRTWLERRLGRPVEDAPPFESPADHPDLDAWIDAAIAAATTDRRVE